MNLVFAEQERSTGMPGIVWSKRFSCNRGERSGRYPGGTGGQIPKFEKQMPFSRIWPNVGIDPKKGDFQLGLSYGDKPKQMVFGAIQLGFAGGGRFQDWFGQGWRSDDHGRRAPVATSGLRESEA